MIPRLTLQTKVTLVVHQKELKRTTNTGRLAIAALTNSEMKIRGVDRKPLDLSYLLSPEYLTLLFFPTEDAHELNSEYLTENRDHRPVQLIVPDGNWRQAGKVQVRHQELAQCPRVMIKTPNLALHHLRAESNAYGMSTLEAIAHALGVLEGEEVKAKMMALYNAKLQATLKGRGVQIS